MTPKQQFRRMLWEDYYSKLEYHPIEGYELGIAEINRVAAKYNCPSLAMEESPLLPFRVAHALYEGSKDRSSLYRKLNLDIYPDHDGSSIIVTLSYDIPRGSISVDVKGNGSDAFTLIVKRRRHQTAEDAKYATSVAIGKFDNVELKDLAQVALDAIANELRG